MVVALEPREYVVRFVDGPHAGRRGLVTCLPPAPIALYVLPDGGIVSPDRIAAGDRDAQALAHRAALYLEVGPAPRGEPVPYVLHRQRTA